MPDWRMPCTPARNPRENRGDEAALTGEEPSGAAALNAEEGVALRPRAWSQTNAKDRLGGATT